MVQHPLERVFEFEDPAFRTYIYNQPTVRKLEVAYESMADSDNPLVRYTAGWAAADLGLHRNYRAQNNGLSAERRNEALDTALACWRNISDFATFRDIQPTEERRLDVESFDIRRLQAIAYIPAMRLGAAALANERFPEKEAQSLWRQTFTGALGVSKVVTQLPQYKPRQKTARAGLANEALCGLVDLSMPARRYIPSPASIRHDLHADRFRRSDLMVLDSYRPQKIMQQVKPDSDWPALYEKSRMMITPRRDLLPHGFLTFSSAVVLEEINQRVSAGKKPWELDLLTEPGQRMEARVQEFQAAR
jgi:hypothetical protein